jgi:protein TonB
LNEDSARTSVTDRLSSTLFVAALFHGIVILGVTFTSAPLGDADALPTLRITLVTDGPQSADTNAEADYLAQRSVVGSGDLNGVERPTRTLGTDSPINRSSEADGANLNDGRPRELAPSPELLLTRETSSIQLDAQPRPNDDPAAQIQASANFAATATVPTLATEIDYQTLIPREEQRELFASASTRESTVAEYLNTWRSRVEQIGTRNFPAQARASAEAENPTLEVAIDATGRLVEIIIRESSGDTTLDQAALTILRMAAPFEPLPAEIIAEYNVLRFAYEWDFEGG